MANLGDLRREVKKAYRRLKDDGGWRAVGAEFGISGGMAFRIAKRGYEPKDARIRARLGLPAMGLAPVCEVCGEVHVRKGCPQTADGRRRRRRRGGWPEWVV